MYLLPGLAGTNTNFSWHLSVPRLAFERVEVRVILGTWLLEARLEFGQVSQGRGLDGAVMRRVFCKTHCLIV